MISDAFLYSSVRQFLRVLVDDLHVPRGANHARHLRSLVPLHEVINTDEPQGPKQHANVLNKMRLDPVVHEGQERRPKHHGPHDKDLQRPVPDIVGQIDPQDDDHEHAEREDNDEASNQRPRDDDRLHEPRYGHQQMVYSKAHADAGEFIVLDEFRLLLLVPFEVFGGLPLDELVLDIPGCLRTGLFIVLVAEPLEPLPRCLGQALNRRQGHERCPDGVQLAAPWNRKPLEADQEPRSHGVGDDHRVHREPDGQG
mmetsp:Transcript_1776/g.4112  ORF Transcript_1776/g.4112 Transcript_1776/m.4112 type:complete len:255 (+) Transcript_1776:1904-2668(+)